MTRQEGSYPFVLDPDCTGTLESHGLVRAKSCRANVESMDVDVAVVLLTLIHRMGRAHKGLPSSAY